VILWPNADGYPGSAGSGLVIGQKLHEYDCFDRIVLADVDTVFAQQLAARTSRTSRFVVVQANAMNIDGLASLMKEHSVTVTCNACVCQTNHSVLEACPRAGFPLPRYGRGHLLRARRASGRGKLPSRPRIEKFHQPFLDRNLAGILCMGMDPGAVNVFARWAIDRLDTASSIRVLDADNAEVKGYRFAVLFSPETFFEELGAAPYYVKDGPRHQRQTA